MSGALRAAGDVALWEKQPDESDKAFAAFRVYLELGPEKRSISKVVQHRADNGMGKSRSTVSKWSSRFRWTARVEAFDAEAVRTQDETTFELLQRRGERQAEIAVRFLDSLELPALELERRLAEADTDEKRAELLEELDLPELLRTIQGAARALPRVVQVERLARGQSTTNVGGHDGGPIETASRVEAEKWASEAPESELSAFLLGAAAERTRLEEAAEKPAQKPKKQPKSKGAKR